MPTFSDALALDLFYGDVKLAGFLDDADDVTEEPKISICIEAGYVCLGFDCPVRRPRPDQEHCYTCGLPMTWVPERQI